MRYACPAIDSIWFEQSKLARWMRVWKAQLAAVDHPMTPLSIWDFERQVADVERVTGHDVAATVEVVRGHLLDSGQAEAAKWLHYGLCSSDVVDAGWLLGFGECSNTLDQLSRGVIDALHELSGRVKGSSALYRTHGQAAQVAEASARWIGYANEFIFATQNQQADRPTSLGLCGPTGTGTALTDEQRDQIIHDLWLIDRPLSGQQAGDRTSWATWLHSVASLATLAQRVATQIRLLAYEEVREASEGRREGYVGSSSMPHKSADGRSNPTRSERICGMASVIRGMANSYAEAASSVWDSHSLEHSCADRILIPQITGYTGFVLTELADVLRTLKLDAHETFRNVEYAKRDWPDGEDSYTRRNRLLRESTEQ